LTPFTNASVAPQISLVQLLKQQFIRGITANTATLHKDNSFTLTSTVTVADFIAELQMGIADFP